MRGPIGHTYFLPNRIPTEEFFAVLLKYSSTCHRIFFTQPSYLSPSNSERGLPSTWGAVNVSNPPYVPCKHADQRWGYKQGALYTAASGPHTDTCKPTGCPGAGKESSPGNAWLETSAGPLGIWKLSGPLSSCSVSLQSGPARHIAAGIWPHPSLLSPHSAGQTHPSKPSTPTPMTGLSSPGHWEVLTVGMGKRLQPLRTGGRIRARGSNTGGD